MVNASSPARPERLAGAPAHDGDWPAQAADTIERVVGSVRDKTAGPALKAARAVVYGLFAALVGLVVAVMLVVMAVRVLDNYLPDAVFGEDHMWAAYLILGVVFLLSAAVLWPRRKPREDRVARGR
jgi:hypothetical protein